MSDYVSNDMQDDFDMEAFNNTDWAAMAEAFKNDPLPQYSQADWDELQGMFDRDPYWGPGSRFGFPPPMPVQDDACLHVVQPGATADDVQDLTQPLQPTGYRCKEEGCKRASLPFKRLPDLRRHQRLHKKERPFSCRAISCNRTAQNGFTRKDKCVDHMLDGHDDDTPFSCGLCAREPLPRSLMSLHHKYHYRWRESTMEPINDHRKCPIPQCKFRIYINRRDSTLDPLQDHLCSSDHSRKSRLSSEGLLLQRGYDALSGDIVCPICPDKTAFYKHLDFYRHFLGYHLDMPDASTISIACTWGSPPVHDFLRGYKEISDEVREHRRTILSLWPYLVCLDAVWDDIKPIKP